MAEQQDQSTTKKDNPYIRQTIMPGASFRRTLRRILTVFLLAILFGAAAAASFYFVHRQLKQLEPQETTSAESVQFGTDEVPSGEAETGAASETARTEETTKETADETQAEESGSAEALPEISGLSEAEVRQLIEQQLNADRADLEDYKALYSELRSVVNTAGHSLVTVTAANSQLDLFNTEYSYETDTFGIIVAITAHEVLILTPEAIISRLSESCSLKISFYDQTTAAAYTKATDRISGLAVLAVSVDALSDYTLKTIRAISLGNSYQCYTGQPVIALGAPDGSLGAVRYGIVSYIDKSQAAEDNNLWILRSDIISSESSRGFLLNLDGVLIGWIDPAYYSGYSLAAIGISDIKSYVENLSNGSSIAYLGIFGTNSGSISSGDQQLAAGGIYINSCAEGSPAMLAGLQNGDILIRAADQSITRLSDLKAVLLSMNVSQTVEITVLRRTKDSYQELTYNVKLQTR